MSQNEKTLLFDNNITAMHEKQLQLPTRPPAIGTPREDGPQYKPRNSTSRSFFKLGQVFHVDLLQHPETGISSTRKNSYGQEVPVRPRRFIVVQEKQENSFRAIPIKSYSNTVVKKEPSFAQLNRRSRIGRQTPGRNSDVLEPTVPCEIGGRWSCAFPDSGADANYISADEVKRLAYAVDTKSVSRVRLASGGFAYTLGTVDLPFSFEGEHQTHPLRFHVVERCIQSLILGCSFLWATQTFTKYRHRIREVFRPAAAYRVRYIGAPRLRVHGYLEGEETLALPDSGSDLSLLSANYAKLRGWTVDRSAEHCVDVEFADGTLGRTTGLVHGLSWDYDLPRGERHREDFYIYDGLECPILLSHGFLRDSEAFARHEHNFTWASDEDCEDIQFGRLSIIKLAASRADGGQGLRRLLGAREWTCRPCTTLLRNRAPSCPILGFTSPPMIL